MKLRWPCQHIDDEHPDGHYEEHSWEESWGLDGWRFCPGGVFLPDDTLIIPNSCPICGHEFNRHDPEDGKCDAYPGGDHCNPFKVVAFLSAVALVGLPEALDALSVRDDHE